MIDIDVFLEKVAESMSAKVATWTDVNDAIDRNISFGMLVDIDRYCTEEERDILRQKTFIGGYKFKEKQN